MHAYQPHFVSVKPFVGVHTLQGALHLDSSNRQGTPCWAVRSVASLILVTLTFSPFTLRCVAKQIDHANAGLQTAPLIAVLPNDVLVTLVSGTSNNQSVFLGGAEGPPLDSGKQQILLLKVANKSDRPLHFSSIVRTCACQDIKASSGFAAPGDNIDFAVKYKVPTNARRGRYNIGFELLDESGRTVAAIKVFGDVIGCLSLEAESIYESVENVTEWKIPIIVTAPVDLAGIELVMSESLRDLTAKLDVVNGTPCLIVTGPEMALGESGLSGEIKILHSKSGAMDIATVLFVKRRLIQISPIVSRFQKSPEGDAEKLPPVWRGRFLVRAAPEVGTLKSLVCSAEGWDTGVDSKEIRNGIWRVEVRVAPLGKDTATNVWEDDEIHLVWKLATDSEVVEVVTTGFLNKE